MATIRKRVGPKGTRYMAVVRCEGQSCTATFRTKSEAKKWAGITEAEITKGKHLPNPEAKRRTVRDLLERYKRSEIPKKRFPILIILNGKIARYLGNYLLAKSLVDLRLA